MKRISYYMLLIIAISLLITACEKNSVEIVSQDLSYQLDPDYIFVDIPKEFNYNPENIIFLDGQTNVTLTGRNDTKNTTIVEGNSITFKIKVKRALGEDVNIRLVKDESLLSQYVGEKVGFKDFPEETYVISNKKLSAGETEVEVTLDIKELDLLNEVPGYLLPLRLELENPVDGLKLSVVKYSVFVKLNITIMRDNIDSSNKPIEGTLFNSTITFESSKSSGLQYLKDGYEEGGGTWFPSRITDYLTLKLPEKVLIQGVKIISKEDDYQFASATIKVEETDGYMPHGKYETSQKANIHYIKFKEPVFTKNIRLEEMLSLTGNATPDFYEVYLIK